VVRTGRGRGVGYRLGGRGVNWVCNMVLDRIVFFFLMPEGVLLSVSTVQQRLILEVCVFVCLHI
jgi:hypothetical protein